MNFWLRLLWTLLTAGQRPPLGPLDLSSKPMRVWPIDLDISLHMNNGRYLTAMDLGRLDLIIRCGLWRVVVAERLTPIVSKASIRFRRELGPLQRYDLETRIIGWLDSTVVIQQRFIVATGPRQGQIAADALVRAGLYDRRARRFVPVTELMTKLKFEAVSPPLPPGAAAFLAAEDAMREDERQERARS